MSNAKFEIKYITTRWHDKTTLLEVVESQYFLPIAEVLEDSFETFTTIYPRVEDLQYSQLAIAFKDKRYSTAPVIVLSDGTTMQLKNVVHPKSGRTWWIEPGEWNPQSRVWLTNTHRTAGTITLRIGKQTLELHITLSKASKDELDKYLIDFKSDMWELVLDENSYIQGEAKQDVVGSVDDTTLNIVDSVLHYARKVLKNPKSELREIQTLKPRKAVKPVPRTFMELATKGNSRILTSRGVKPNYNVSENSYVLYALMATQRIVSQLCRVSQSKTERLSNNLQKLDLRLDSLKDYKEVNRDLVVKDYKMALNAVNVDNINQFIHQQLVKINGGYFSSEYSVGFLKVQKLTNNGDGYFCELKYNQNEPWGRLEPAQTMIFSLEDTHLPLFKPYSEYRLCARMPVSWYKNNTIAVFKPEYIHSIELLPSTEWVMRAREKTEKMKHQAILLKNNNWQMKLSSDELAEQEKERSTINNRKVFFSKQLQNISHVRDFLAPKEKQLRDLVKQFISLGIKPKSTFPNSMTFVQNPSYQAVHAGYKKLREQVGLTDEDILMSLEKIDSIGLVNIPLLYERWCLLQLIKSFTHSFRFIAEDGWKRKLLKILERKHSNEAIHFSNTDLKREILLRYEPRLKSGKTPDFVMDMAFEGKDGTQSQKRVVLDAKFYSRAFMRKRGGLSGVLEELAIHKDYSEGKQNSVFVLHPTTQALRDAGGPVSPQAWGEVSYLGELQLFDWDNRNYPHQYGAVCLNPLISHQHSDELQRLIGMLLQYEPINSGKNDDVTNHNVCIGCGSSSLRVVEHSQRNSKKVWYQCNECDLFTVYNHCHNCHHRLIKNGEYWTYHSTMPMQPINIKCPKCETPL